MAVTAGVIGGSLKATGVTPLDVTTQGRCAAALHGLDDFEMRNRQRMVAAMARHRRERYRPVQRRFLLLPAADRRPAWLRPSITGACREDSWAYPLQLSLSKAVLACAAWHNQAPRCRKWVSAYDFILREARWARG